MQIICFWSRPRIFITIRGRSGLLCLWAAHSAQLSLSLWGSFHAASEGMCAPETFSFTELKVLALETHLFLSLLFLFFFFFFFLLLFCVCLLVFVGFFCLSVCLLACLFVCVGIFFVWLVFFFVLFLFPAHLIPLAECWQEPDEKIPVSILNINLDLCVFEYMDWVHMFEYMWAHLYFQYISGNIIIRHLKNTPHHHLTGSRDWL